VAGLLEFSRTTVIITRRSSLVRAGTAGEHARPANTPAANRRGRSSRGDVGDRGLAEGDQIRGREFDLQSTLPGTDHDGGKPLGAGVDDGAERLRWPNGEIPPAT